MDNQYQNIDELYEKLTGEEYRNRISTLFCLWNKRQLVAAYGHYLAAARCTWLERFFSIVNICAAIFVLFLSANTKLSQLIFEFFEWPVENAAIAVSIGSVLVVLSSATQYILQFGARGALHKQAGNEFSNLRRKIERYWTRGNIHPEAIHSLARSYNMISRSSPLVRPPLWNRGEVAKEVEADEINRLLFATPPKAGPSKS
ncbi:MAG: hypothetical protein AAF700_00005 [Pseudomonadota bacterium]